MVRENRHSIELMYARARAISSLLGFDNFLVVFFIGLKGDPLFDFDGDASSGKFHLGFCDQRYRVQRPAYTFPRVSRS